MPAAGAHTDGMALLGFIAIYGLTFLVCAVLHLVRQIDAWTARESPPFPRIATMWFALAAIGSVVILGVNSRPRTYQHLGNVAPLYSMPAKPHAMAPLASACAGRGAAASHQITPNATAAIRRRVMPRGNARRGVRLRGVVRFAGCRPSG